MANYSTSAVIQPSLPADLITDAEIEFLELFGFMVFFDPGKVYFATTEYQGSGLDEDEQEVDESDLEQFLQALIKSSNGELKWISIEFAFSCDKLRADGFGGGAVFITADDVKWNSTSMWLEKQIYETETGNFQ